GHGVLGGPLVLIVAAGIGVGAHDVDLAGSEAGEGAAVGVGLHNVLKIGDVLAKVLLQPEGGIDVARRRGGVGDRPVGAVDVFPSQFLTGVDLGGELLALGRGAGYHE